MTVTGSSLSGQTSGGAVSSGTYTNGSGAYGVGSGVIRSSDNVSDYGDGANTAPGFTTNFGPGATARRKPCSTQSPAVGSIISTSPSSI